ncbi:uncharacterized protein LOC141535901 [Cotesia typhae]|uniref:uncharacterized protein LOC141535901 n=1 Tax=Cotesia typhae TaxID=2053667 RepID=UPI003D68FA25
MKCELLDESSEKLKVSFDKRMELLKAASKQRTREKDLLKENLPPAKKQKLQEDNLSSDPKKSPKKTIVPLEEAKSLENEEISDTEEESTSPEVSLNPSHTQPRKPPVGLKVRSNELFADLMGSGNSASNSVLRKEEINSPPHQGKIETLSEAMREICVLKKINNECKNKLRVKDNIILVKTKELQDLKVKYEEAIERNNKLQGEVIEGQKLVLEGLKNIKAAGIDKEPEMKIGFIDEEKGQVYMGYDKWITTNFYHKLMALPKIQLFVENVARFVFGDEVLLKAPSAVKLQTDQKINPLKFIN